MPKVHGLDKTTDPKSGIQVKRKGIPKATPVELKCVPQPGKRQRRAGIRRKITGPRPQHMLHP